MVTNMLELINKMLNMEQDVSHGLMEIPTREGTSGDTAMVQEFSLGQMVMSVNQNM